MQHREVLVEERLACVGCRAQPFGTPCRWVACGRCGEESTSRCGRCCPWQVGVLKGNKMLRATEYKCGKRWDLGKETYIKGNFRDNPARAAQKKIDSEEEEANARFFHGGPPR